MKVVRATSDEMRDWSFVPETGWITAVTGTYGEYEPRSNGRHLFSKSYLVWL